MAQLGDPIFRRADRVGLIAAWDARASQNLFVLPAL